jgi:hypothetical protein
MISLSLVSPLSLSHSLWLNISLCHTIYVSSLSRHTNLQRKYRTVSGIVSKDPGLLLWPRRLRRRYSLCDQFALHLNVRAEGLNAADQGTRSILCLSAAAAVAITAAVVQTFSACLHVAGESKSAGERKRKYERRNKYNLFCYCWITVRHGELGTDFFQRATP